MNVQYVEPILSLRLLIVNPLSQPTGALICMNALNGALFGPNVVVELKLVVYAYEIEAATQLKHELEFCALPLDNGITISSDLPSLEDADIFVFLTEFTSLNCMDLRRIDEEINFDSLYLILKIAMNLEIPIPPSTGLPVEEPLANLRKKKPKEKKLTRSIIVTEGLFPMHVIKSFSKNLPNDIFYCTSAPLSSVSRNILADKMSVQCVNLNREYVWAANNQVFHIEFAMPLCINDDKGYFKEHCEWDGLDDKGYRDLEMDCTQFNAGWMKKDLPSKVAKTCAIQPMGDVFKTAYIMNTLRQLWQVRYAENPKQFLEVNMGVISDGSLGTHKGLPYILPIILEKESYKVDRYLEDDHHLKFELQRINKAAVENHQKMMRYCKKFLQDNVVDNDNKSLRKTCHCTSSNYTSTIYTY